MKISSLLVGLLLSLNVFASRIEADVIGMTCGMCVESITKELKATEKVEHIRIDLDAKLLSMEEVKGKKISDSEIKNAVKKAGKQYEAMKIRRKS
jgi:copper chaperone CopZ